MTLRGDEGRVVLTVADDGVGPAASAAAKGSPSPAPAAGDVATDDRTAGEDPQEGHFGTRLLADLSAEVGGTFVLAERDGGGAEGRFTLPLR